LSGNGTRVGIDFGTTNSAVAWSRPGEPVQLSQSNFRSILFFEAEHGYSKLAPVPHAGPAAINAYLSRNDPGRLIQSIKSLASDRSFRRTQVAGHYFSFEDLVAAILNALVYPVRDLLRESGTKIVAGRPVQFVGAKTKEDDVFAEERLRRAFQLAGLPEITFEYEPIAAAYFYETRLDHDEIVLIADFGGGTSDFSVVRVGPGVREVPKAGRILANKGLPFAGDAFDAAIIRHLVSPLLGRGSHYHSLGKSLPAPGWIYRNLERWHHLSFLRSRETMQVMRSVRAEADDPDAISALIRLVEDDLGFQLHQAVQRAKSELSLSQACIFRFAEPGLIIEREVTRDQFESWIRPELTRIAETVDQAIRDASLSPKQIDRVFLTGGTSLVPAVRSIFEQRTGADRISAGNEFTSVVEGLALRADALA
jgi:hypothetical chaperone protein